MENPVSAILQPPAPALSRHADLDRYLESYLWHFTYKYIAPLELEDCIVYLRDSTGRYLQKTALGPKNKGRGIETPLTIDPGSGIVGTAIVSGRAELVGDTTRDKRYIVDDAFRESEIAVPVCFHGEVLAVIDSEHSGKDYYRQKHLQLFSGLAEICAYDLVRIRREYHLQQALQQLDGLQAGQPFPPAGSPPRKLALPTLTGCLYVAPEEIVCLSASSNYTQVHLCNRKTITVSRTLKDFEHRLREQGFLRVHHAYLVNTRHMQEYTRSDGGMLVLSNGQEVPVASRRRQLIEDNVAAFL